MTEQESPSQRQERPDVEEENEFASVKVRGVRISCADPVRSFGASSKSKCKSSRANKNLSKDQLNAAVEKQPWDGSVKALVATPSVLTMMSTKLDWTQKLGDTFLAQQTDVMDAIQRLRSKAHANNKLTSTAEQKVTVRQEDNRQVIAIEPTDPNTVHVPYYDPAVVYGQWPYPDNPPYYFPDTYPG